LIAHIAIDEGKQIRFPTGGAIAASIVFRIPAQMELLPLWAFIMEDCQGSMIQVVLHSNRLSLTITIEQLRRDLRRTYRLLLPGCTLFGRIAERKRALKQNADRIPGDMRTVAA